MILDRFYRDLNLIDRLAIRLPFLAYYLESNSDGIMELTDNRYSAVRLTETGYVCDGVYPYAFLRMGWRKKDGFFYLPFRFVNLDSDGFVSNSNVPWDSIATSCSSLAVRVVMHDPRGNIPYIEFKGSPAKLAQGHNVFGTDDFTKSVDTMFFALHNFFPDWDLFFDEDSAHLSLMDINYHSRAKDDSEALEFLKLMKRVSIGQVKAALAAGKGIKKDYTTTAYWNQNSELRTLKLYMKLQECLQDIDKAKTQIEKERKKRIYTKELLAFCEGMLRWECCIKARWFKEHGYRNLKEIETGFQSGALTCEKLWKDAFKDLFSGLKGMNMNTVNCTNDELIVKLKQAAKKYVTKTVKKELVKPEDEFKEAHIDMLSKGFEQIAVTTTKGITTARYEKKHYAGDGLVRRSAALLNDIKERGYQVVKENTPRQTFHAQQKLLNMAGMSIIYLQSFQGQPEEDRSNIIPMVRFTVVDFGSQVPDWAEVA